MAVDGRGCWNAHGRASEQQPALPGGWQLLALPGADIKGSSSSCRVDHGLIPEREGGEALGAIPGLSVLSLSQRCTCAPLFCVEMSKPTGASGFLEGSGVFHTPFVLPTVGGSSGSSWSAAIPLGQKVKGSLILKPGGLLVVSWSCGQQSLMHEQGNPAQNVPPGKIINR